MPMPHGLCTALFKHLPDAVFLIDPDSAHILDCNDAALTHLGRQRSEVLGQSVLSLQTGVAGPDQWRSMSQAIRASDNFVHIGEHRHPSGSSVPVQLHISHFVHDGREYFLSTTRNISQRQALERDLHSRDAQLRYALNEASDGLWDWNLLTNEVYFSPQLARMLGYGPHEIKATLETWLSKVHPEDSLWVNRAKQEHIDGQRSRFNAEYRLRNRSGHYLWVHDRGRICERDANGQPARMIGMVHNITDKKTIELTLQAMASHDTLTGLHNRRECDLLLGRQVDLCHRLEIPLGLCFLDIDNFKSVNDDFGHAVGDKVLRRVAQTIAGEVRSTDDLSRCGGEEFLLLCTDTPEPDLLHLAEKLRSKIAAINWDDIAGLPALTCSFGVAVFPDHADTAESLFIAAESALTRAKGLGRNRVESASALMSTPIGFQRFKASSPADLD
ncbi:sensor domain-containing diguanylate cyclase [Rhodoferax antarcticus]|uniref:Putative diguanylate cyclase with PAS/PAC sensor n=1 Tax=Rhodoferax antarcticus ANT.BR TaxID=1111071 RepID=A0A1Q8YH83_9BURK|nr:diguanylate cyclase [Rhodoferax antarcticus]APW45163.1 hypothetical protein RA876_00870 [Rhodoferax antarcticus]OLP07414.1 putative diguanylate cyclase with PAS/PAC sensor [Rhodoferax antarcticus ANT.BR]